MRRAHPVAAVVEEAIGQNGGRAPEPDLPGDGIDGAEITANHNGTSNDLEANAAVRFAVKVVREHGHGTEDDVNAVKSAGYDDAQVMEIVLHVALNTWTNYINVVGKTDIDFPFGTARKLM
jgi:alkylhydroperoxidase family enzyme